MRAHENQKKQRHIKSAALTTVGIYPPRMTVLAMAICSMVLYTAVPQQTHAQIVPASQLAAEQQNYNIPAGPLAASLRNLASTANVPLSFTADQTDGKTGKAVRGQFTPQGAFAVLLANSGLQAVRLDSGAYVLRTATSINGEAVLPAVTATADHAALTESASGYVAKRSATGTKTNTPLIEIPQSISVITEAQIREQNPQTLGDAVRYTSGVVVQEGFNRTDDPFIIRGFDVRTNPGVMYRDGLKLPLPHYSAMAEPYALESIEIVKGPASVLYGQAAPGGVVNIVSKRPTDKALREIQVSGGSHNNKQVAFDLGGPIDNDGKLTYRLTGLVRDSGTMIDYIPDDRYFIAPSLTWRISADTSLTVLSSFMRNKTINSAGYPLEGTVKYNPNGRIASRLFTGEPEWSKWDQDAGTLGYQFAHRINETWQFKQNLVYAQSSNRVNHAYLGGWQAGSNFSVAERGAYRRDDDAHGTSVDNQIHGSWSSGRFKHNVLFGLDYTRTSLTREQYAAFNNLTPLNLFNPQYGSAVVLPADPNTYTVETRNQTGFYAQDQIKIDDKLVLLLSGRYDDAKGKTVNKLTNKATESADTAFTWRAGMLYQADNGVSPYISYATSFQPQTGTTSPARGTTPFDPTKGKQWELGVKYQPVGFNSFMTASLFELTRTNVPTTDLANPIYNVQTGEVRSRGLELSATASLASGWNLIGAYTYTDAEITKSNNATKGNTPEAVPRNMLSLWSDYTVQGGGLAGLNVGGGARYIGSSFNTGNTAKVDSYTIFDAVLRYDLGAHNPAFKGISLDLTARNLFDKEYVASCTYACFYGERRSILGRITYKW
jgi:iron complex outermembrane receptor protein